MNDFIRRYGRYLLFLPIGALLTAIGFFVGEHRATLARTERLPDEIASQHPRITPPQSSSHDLQAALAPAVAQPSEETQPEEEPPEPAHIRPTSWVGIAVLLIPFIIAIVAIALNANSHIPTMSMQPVQGGDPARGRQAIAAFGCGACHTIAGVPGANGKVGPALDANLAQRTFIAGKLPNTPDNLIHWIMDPQGVTPGTDMPNMGIPEQSARDIAAYIYSLK